ncbi:hypothetical protein PUNSTDRAFT_92956 [Punctularia strigosozonata HHB-11173 SS5]|uniref:Transcription factor CBF/NF-Y/archaeal histone domain-containing protein n=1 Tax=Punctularia strigosozonata (strain HHB-11173) TaxID=741275 RepID=R7S5C1_PUNST|nr:uncharacterized protein PUNSTDRAFT_92956 [Punctularia strigosozonata HHB-11173 SS5]EIN04571.1 hypothetical protein PUNSTDRAFT_92956 [Punctularia strigosozonata HHB-11173 SS5]
MKNRSKITKFPVARIKRIMQKDEDVGKMSQATPIVICASPRRRTPKALELFLGQLVDEAAKVTSDRGSKRVEAYHLKHAVETVEMLDFLKEIVEAVPDPSAGGTIPIEPKSSASGAASRRAQASHSFSSAPDVDEDSDGGEPKKKKRVRKKKVAPIGDDGAGAGGAEAAPKKRRAAPRKKVGAPALPGMGVGLGEESMTVDAAEPARERGMREEAMEQDYDEREDEGGYASGPARARTDDEDDEED